MFLGLKEFVCYFEFVKGNDFFFSSKTKSYAGILIFVFLFFVINLLLWNVYLQKLWEEVIWIYFFYFLVLGQFGEIVYVVLYIDQINQIYKFIIETKWLISMIDN